MIDEVTIGELARRLDGLERSIGRQFDSVTRQITSLSFVSRDAYEAQREAIMERLIELEEGRKWMARAVITALLFPVITAIIIVLVVGGG